MFDECDSYDDFSSAEHDLINEAEEALSAADVKVTEDVISTVDIHIPDVNNDDDIDRYCMRKESETIDDSKNPSDKKPTKREQVRELYLEFKSEYPRGVPPRKAVLIMIQNKMNVTPNNAAAYYGYLKRNNVL